MRIALCYNGRMCIYDAASGGFIQWRTVPTLALVVFLCLAGLAEAAEHKAPPEVADPTSVSVVRDRILVRTWLNGEGPYAFILDTGVGTPIIDRQSAQTLRLAPVPSSETGGTHSGVAVASMQLADAPPVGRKCVTMDLTPFARILGATVVGVTGLPVDGREFTLDVPAGRLSFVAGAGIHRTAVPGAAETGKMSLDVTLNGGKTVTAVIDTSFGGMLGVTEAQAMELGLLTTGAPRLENISAADNGSTGTTLFRAESLKAGPVEVRNPVCRLLAADAHLVLGVSFLRLCSVTVSAGGARISLEPRTSMPYMDPPITGYGLGLVSFEGGYWTVAVAKGSPAARGGAQSMDRLLQIDKESMKDKPFEAVSSRLLAAPKTEIQVVLERGGSRAAMTLQAEELL